MNNRANIIKSNVMTFIEALVNFDNDQDKYCIDKEPNDRLYFLRDRKGNHNSRYLSSIEKIKNCELSEFFEIAFNSFENYTIHEIQSLVDSWRFFNKNIEPWSAVKEAWNSTAMLKKRDDQALKTNYLITVFNALNRIECSDVKFFHGLIVECRRFSKEIKSWLNVYGRYAGNAERAKIDYARINNNG